jgi:autotransporter-associated beta strand protein
MLRLQGTCVQRANNPIHLTPRPVSRWRRRAALLAIAVAPMAAWLWTTPALAQTLTWDASGTSPTAPTDGDGNWNTTNTNWTDGATNVSWINGDVAAFGNGGTAGTVTINDVSGTVSASGINFNPVSSGAYTIAASGANTLTLTGGAAINLASGVTPTIGAPIAGSAGLALTGAGTLNLTGNNTFTGTVAINSGALVIGTGGNLGADSNNVSLGTPNSGTSSGDAVGALVIGPGVSTTIGSFKSATNNTSGVNTVTIGSGATLNVVSNAALPGINGTVNGAFVVGSSNAASAIVTNLTIAGAGTLNVNGGSNNSSFVVGLGNGTATSSNTFSMAPFLDMSQLSNFSFTTGTGVVPANGGNEFAVGVGSSASAKVNLAVNSTIVAGTVAVGDNSIPTPGLTGVSGNNASNPNTLTLGTGINTINANTIILGNGRAIGNLIFASSTGTGSVTIAGASGGASTANIVVGTSSGGTPASTASALNLASHSAVVQAGNLTVGSLAGGSGGTSTTKGGNVTFDTGTFSVANLQLAVATSGTAGGAIAGTFTLGKDATSTGVLNVTNSFLIASNTGGSAQSKGTFNVKGGTANINANIIDNSTNSVSNTTVALTGGTLNMNGFAIGTTAPTTGGTRHISTITLPATSATLANLGGDGINGAGLTMNAAGTLRLAGVNSYSGATTASTGTLAILNTSNVGHGTLTVAAGAFVDVQAGNATAQKVAALSIAGTGTMDMNDNDIVVGSATPETAVVAAIVSARNAGAWNGPGLTSAAAASNTNHSTTLGVLSGAEYSSVGGAGNFSGQSYADVDTLVKYTYYGDTDFNGKVNFDDYVRTDSGFNNHLTGWLNGDFDLNGQVNFDDYVLIDLAFNTQNGTLGRALSFLDGTDRSTHEMNASSLQKLEQHFDQFGEGYAHSFLAAVPEPAGLSGLALGLVALCNRRRRRGM